MNRCNVYLIHVGYPVIYEFLYLEVLAVDFVEEPFVTQQLWLLHNTLNDLLANLMLPHPHVLSEPL